MFEVETTRNLWSLKSFLSGTSGHFQLKARPSLHNTRHGHIQSFERTNERFHLDSLPGHLCSHLC